MPQVFKPGGFVVTRGFGPDASVTNLIVQGFLPADIIELAVEAAKRTIRGGRREARRLYEDLTERFKISAMLVARNGKEFTNPIFNSITKITNDDAYSVEVKPKSIESKKTDNVKVSIKSLKVRN